MFRQAYIRFYKDKGKKYGCGGAVVSDRWLWYQSWCNDDEDDEDDDDDDTEDDDEDDDDDDFSQLRFVVTAAHCIENCTGWEVFSSFFLSFFKN